MTPALLRRIRRVRHRQPPVERPGDTSQDRRKNRLRFCLGTLTNVPGLILPRDIAGLT